LYAAVNSLTELAAMFLLPRRRSAAGPDIEYLEQRIIQLRAALNEAREQVGRRARVSHRVIALLAAVVFMAGFVVGSYRGEIAEFTVTLAQTIGLAKTSPAARDPEIAYQRGDYETALRLARPLAARGDVRGQSVLGRLYHGGYAVPQDFKEAARLLRSAAEQGDAQAQLHLGVMFSEGQSVPQDHVQAAQWYRRAADQGEPHAQYNLGIFYATGEIGQVDRVSAYMWLTLAVAQFSAGDARRRTAVSSRNLIAKQMTHDQIMEAQKRASEWKPNRPSPG
jgi:hypothetical protein